LVQPHAVQTSH
jgi:hypothetical protein